MSPFVYHICLFRILQDRDVDLESGADRSLEATLIRAILDVFWSRARSTVGKNKNIVIADIKRLKAKGLTGSYYDPGPTPFLDIFGIEAAVSVLSDTQGVGRYHTDHKQWDSSRKVKSAIANFEKIGYDSVWSRLSLVDEEKGHTKRFHFGGTSSLWYYRFATGCRARMGQDYRQDLVLSVELWEQVFNTCEIQIKNSISFNEGAK